MDGVHCAGRLDLGFYLKLAVHLRNAGIININLFIQFEVSKCFARCFSNISGVKRGDGRGT